MEYTDTMTATERIIVSWPELLFPDSAVDMLKLITGGVNAHDISIGSQVYGARTLYVASVQDMPSDIPGMVEVEVEIERRDGSSGEAIPFEFLKDATIRRVSG